MIANLDPVPTVPAARAVTGDRDRPGDSDFDRAYDGPSSDRDLIDSDLATSSVPFGQPAPPRPVARLDRTSDAQKQSASDLSSDKTGRCAQAFADDAGDTRTNDAKTVTATDTAISAMSETESDGNAGLAPAMVPDGTAQDDAGATILPRLDVAGSSLSMQAQIAQAQIWMATPQASDPDPVAGLALSPVTEAAPGPGLRIKAEGLAPTDKDRDAKGDSAFDDILTDVATDARDHLDAAAVPANLRHQKLQHGNPDQQQDLASTIATDRQDQTATLLRMTEDTGRLVDLGQPFGISSMAALHTATPGVAAAYGAPMPPQVLSSIITATLLANKAADQVEVMLSPVELGKVQLGFRHEHGGTQVLLTAERPDTLDLLRRHGGELLTELQKAGFSGATLSFGHWGQSHDGSDKPQDAVQFPGARHQNVQTADVSKFTVASLTQALDLRI